MDSPEVINYDELEFHDIVRKNIICLLLFILLYLTSYSIIKYFKTRADNDELYAGDEDFFVYRVSLWICSFSLAVSIGAVTLLPFSVLGSEIQHSYPDNYYLKWLNWSLINSLWSYIFATSNMSLFVLLPFAYFFIESQGFSFNRKQKSIMARVYETLAVCFFLILLLIILTDLCYTFLFSQQSFSFSLLKLSSSSIPLVYSFISLIGVAMLLLSTPLGFSQMFDVFSNSLILAKPRTHILDISFEERAERLQALSCARRNFVSNRGLYPNGAGHVQTAINGTTRRRSLFQSYVAILDTLKYPVIMMVLLILTIFSVSMVLINTFGLLFGYRALPEYVQYMEIHARHTFGIFGALVEVTLIIYIMVASLVGVYSMPLLSRMKPERHKTSISCIIANCMMILLLSSALPVLARTLGITSFDLLGAYGRLDWISNFSLIWSYNVLFAAVSIFLLSIKFTTPVRRELVRRLWSITRRRTSIKND